MTAARRDERRRAHRGDDRRARHRLGAGRHGAPALRAAPARTGQLSCRVVARDERNHFPNTERPVTVELGTNTLLGLDPAAISEIPASLAQRPTAPPEPPPLWDGKAAERIADILAPPDPELLSA